MKKPIYLDYNGTTPHDPEVIDAMRPFLETEFGNPSSSHWYGIAPAKAVIHARRQIASLINCRPEEIIFTSGGTESNNFAIKGIASAYRNRGNHIITSQIEHPAVLQVCSYLESHGFTITRLPVDGHGLIRVSDVENAIRPETILITLMHANNEVGTIEPVEEIARAAKRKNVIMHTDAAQSMGKIPVDVQKLGVDLLSIAGHKLYAPKGIGALYIREGVEPAPLIHGAGQEKGRRPGTENVLEIAGLGKACEIAKRDMDQNRAHMQAMQEMLYEGLKKEISEIRFNGHPRHRLPNTLSVSFRGLESNRILEQTGLEIAASPGAACHSDTVDISHVLKAMNIPMEWAKGTVRFSTGKMTTADEIRTAIQVIANAIASLKER
ncbi:MAG: cysteine desulfurase family protein [Desulfobacterales bacterium]|nr:cysteine desulfurase family protein [Desulfobacterales bacterium]MDD4071943.1 cysteine desulfurase family protein [Desulfobacterales bacterium]MDD4393757.1 cysteine desulfurase family protein [Desulfobacterales bacterium]